MLSLEISYLNIFVARDDGDNRIFKQRMKTSDYPRDEAMHKIDNLFKVPQSIWKKLYK